MNGFPQRFFLNKLSCHDASSDHIRMLRSEIMRFDKQCRVGRAGKSIIFTIPIKETQGYRKVTNSCPVAAKVVIKYIRSLFPPFLTPPFKPPAYCLPFSTAFPH